MLGGGQILTQRQKAPLPVGGSRPQTVTWSLQPLHRYLGQVTSAPPAPPAYPAISQSGVRGHSDATDKISPKTQLESDPGSTPGRLAKRAGIRR